MHCMAACKWVLNMLGSLGMVGMVEIGLGTVLDCKANPTGIDLALTHEVGDVARGRAIVANRQLGLCLLCHTGPIPEERFQGNLAPDLSGAGDRWSAAQLRLRIVNPAQLNPTSIMPAYFKQGKGLSRVAAAQQGKTLLNAQQIEDVVAYLQTLRKTDATLPANRILEQP